MRTSWAVRRLGWPGVNNCRPVGRLLKAREENDFFLHQGKFRTRTCAAAHTARRTSTVGHSCASGALDRAGDEASVLSGALPGVERVTNAAAEACAADRRPVTLPVHSATRTLQRTNHQQEKSVSGVRLRGWHGRF